MRTPMNMINHVFFPLISKKKDEISPYSFHLFVLAIIRIDTKSVKYPSCNVFLLLMMVFLSGACSTVPIENRNVSVAGGFWEQDENTDPRFYHAAKAENEKIGVLYAAGSNVLVNGSRVEETTDINNNTFISTGPKSSARIEFENNHACLIQIQEFSSGNGYGDTANCQHNITTTHADSQTRNAIYHVNVSNHQTEITVLRGLVKLALLADLDQTIIVNGGEEAIVTTTSIIGPRPISFDEIERRIRWRDNYQFYKSEISWVKVLVGAGVAAAIVNAILRESGGDDSGGNGGYSPPPDYPQPDKGEQRPEQNRVLTPPVGINQTPIPRRERDLTPIDIERTPIQRRVITPVDTDSGQSIR